jgi:hypothetical protein
VKIYIPKQDLFVASSVNDAEVSVFHTRKTTSDVFCHTQPSAGFWFSGLWEDSQLT